MKKRVLLLVIDGLGVGEMDDVHDTRPHDIGSHTLNSIRKFNHSDLSNLANLNLFDLDHPKCLGLNGFNMMIGKSCLGYPGADSYLGHRTIIGNKVNVRPTFVEKIFPIIKEKFSPEFDVTLEDNVICLDRSIFISNNVETDLGLNINVLGILEHQTHDEILRVGHQVRSMVDCARVIVLGGQPLDLQTIKNCVEVKNDNYTFGDIRGICIPKTGIYNENLYAVHLGYKDTNKNNLVDIFLESNLPVSLIGKTDDLFHRDNAYAIPGVQTVFLLKSIEKRLIEQDTGLIFANIQEIDLAGHEQDPYRGSATLNKINEFLPRIWQKLRSDDLFIITADHGNDPLIGHSYHTREFTPLIVIGEHISARKLTPRTTLADVGYSICSYFGLSSPETGSNFLS